MHIDEMLLCPKKKDAVWAILKAVSGVRAEQNVISLVMRVSFHE